MYYNEIKYILYIHVLVQLSVLLSECQVQLQRPYTVSIQYLPVTYQHLIGGSISRERLGRFIPCILIS
jgi:hypothetical protein